MSHEEILDEQRPSVNARRARRPAVFEGHGALGVAILMNSGPSTLPDESNDEVLARPPYAQRPGRDTTNATDEIFPTGGDPALLDVMRTTDGYRAAIGLELPDPEPAW